MLVARHRPPRGVATAQLTVGLARRAVLPAESSLQLQRPAPLPRQNAALPSAHTPSHGAYEDLARTLRRHLSLSLPPLILSPSSGPVTGSFFFFVFKRAERKKEIACGWSSMIGSCVPAEPRTERERGGDSDRLTDAVVGVMLLRSV